MIKRIQRPYGFALACLTAGLLSSIAPSRAQDPSATVEAPPAVGASLPISPPVSDDTRRRYGQHFIIGYYSVQQIEPLVAKGFIGGIFVDRHNFAGRSLDAVRNDIAHLQTIRAANGLPPLVVAADQEGGLVSHLSPPLKRPPSLASVALLPQSDRRAKARALGASIGADLAALGVNVDFAPVADLSNKSAAAERGSNIARRAVSSDPAIVAEVSSAFADGLQDHGVQPTLKHFPGLGRVTQDTHVARARLKATAETLVGTDWLAFRGALRQSPHPIVMATHAVIDAIDPGNPVSQSKTAITGLLREQWGHDGIVVTDDLGMGAVYRAGICEGVTSSLNAGVDWLLVSSNRLYDRLLECVLSAARDNKTDEAMIDASQVRQRTFFQRLTNQTRAARAHPLLPPQPVPSPAQLQARAK